MTSHWNLPPPSMHHSHAGSMGGGKTTKSNSGVSIEEYCVFKNIFD